MSLAYNTTQKLSVSAILHPHDCLQIGDSWVIKFNFRDLCGSFFRKMAVPLVHCVPYTNQCHKQAVCEAVF